MQKDVKVGFIGQGYVGKNYADNLESRGFSVIRYSNDVGFKENKKNDEIKKYFPAHIELGSGPSLELGIPPLHDLHKFFSVSDPNTKKMIFGGKDDNLIVDFISDPNKFVKNISKPILYSVTSKEKLFHKILTVFFNKKLLLGKIFTNNFDGIHLRNNLKEKYIRRFEEKNIIPKVKFSSKTKSLIVVGSHADRRYIQQSARKQGLKIIYVDPEGFVQKGDFIEYLLESPQNEDIIIKMTAEEFAKQIKKIKL